MSTAEQQSVAPQNVEEKVSQSAEQFWSKNSKKILIALGAVVVLVGGYFAYDLLIKKPAENKALDAIWTAQAAFKTDSFKLALNGNGTKANIGFLKVAKEHSGTKAGELAKFYAGVCYLKLEDFNNAIKFLEDFSTSDPNLQIRLYGNLGDAYGETGKFDKAADYYKKASSVFETDEINSAEYLYRLAQVYEKLGKNAEAITAYKQLKEKFPASLHSNDADKNLARLGELN